MDQMIRPSLVGTSHVFTSSNTDAHDSFSIAVMGAAAVGKSVLINKFINGTTLRSYWPTVQERYTKHMDIDGRNVVVDIFDTPGGYCFSYLREEAIANADAFVLVYSVKNEASFETVAILRDMIVEQKPLGVPIIVIGNQTDIPASSRFMSKDNAKFTVTSLWQNEYEEISVKEDSNISHIFTKIVSMARPFISNQIRPRAKARHRLLKNMCNIV